MMDINDFYKRVLSSLDVVTEDGYLKIDEDGVLVDFVDKGVPLVLPEKKHIGSMLCEDESGGVKHVKRLFNPLDETVIKGDSISLTKLKTLVNVRLGNRIAITGALLLSIAENKGHQTKTGMLINQFLIRLSEAKNPGMKQIVDSKTIDSWLRIYDKSFDNTNIKYMVTYVKKGGKLGTVKYNRVTTIKFPIYEELCKLEKNGIINGVRLRNKDIKVFKILFEYLVEGITETGIVTSGSNDNESPGFISLFGTYLRIMGKVQEVVKSIKGVNQEYEDSAAMPLLVEVSELSELSVYKKALAGIPRESDTVKAKLSHNNPIVNTPSVNTDNSTTVPVVNVPVEEDSSVSAIHKALYGNVSGVNVPAIHPGVNQYQQPINQYPTVQQPMTPAYQQMQPPMPQPYQQMQPPMMSQYQQMQPPMPQPYQQMNGYQPSVNIGATGFVGPYGS